MLDPFKQIIKDKKITKQRMVEMWCELNTYKVPKEFKGELLPFKFGSSERAHIAMEDIVSIVGKNACLKEWRKRHCENM